MSELSTRVWLEEHLWNEVRNRAIADGLTVRELIPRLVSQGLAVVPAVPEQPAPVPASAAPPTAGPSPEPGPPVVVLSDVYRCDVCNAEVKLGGLSVHLGRHLKEQRAPEAERS